MADKRTAEQKSADDMLTAAVDVAVDAYGYRADGFLNTTFLVLVEQRGWDPDGDECTGLVTLYKDGEVAELTALGLLRAGALRAERGWVSDE